MNKVKFLSKLNSSESDFKSITPARKRGSGVRDLAGIKREIDKYLDKKK
jgi:hypothetical protein